MQHAAKEVEEKKTKYAGIIEKKDLLQKKSLILAELTMWKRARPFMSADFSNNVIICNLLPIG